MLHHLELKSTQLLKLETKPTQLMRLKLEQEWQQRLELMLLNLGANYLGKIGSLRMRQRDLSTQDSACHALVEVIWSCIYACSTVLPCHPLISPDSIETPLDMEDAGKSALVLKIAAFIT